MPRLTVERLAIWILFILLFTMAVRIPLDTDTWWHLRSGQIMLDEGKILKQDVFSHTRQGEEWINHSWGAQIFLYGTYWLTGGDADPADTGTIGLALFTALLATGGMMLVYRICPGTVYSRMFVLVLGAATAAVFWSPRPQMFSFLFGTITLYLLYLYKYRHLDRLWLVPILMVLWVNLHAGFAIGFIFLFGFMAGEIIGRYLDSENPQTLSWLQIRKVALVTLVGMAVLSINPYGPRMILYPFQTAGIQVLNLFIQEWQSPDFKNPQTWPFVLILVAILIFSSRTQQRINWSDAVLVAGTAGLALWSGRNIAVFAVAATPVLARQVDGWLNERGWQLQPSQKVTPRMMRLNWLLLMLVLVGGLAKIGTDLSPEMVRETHEEFLPTGAVDYLKEYDSTSVLFNDYNWGGYFIFALPDVPVFVDGRTDLYGDDFLEDYVRTYFGAEEWRNSLDDYGVNLVVIPPDSALATLLRENPDTWQIGYEDDVAVIFERGE